MIEDTIARLNALSATIRKHENTSKIPRADLYEFIETFDDMKVNVTSEFRKYAAQLVALEIPEAEHFLKERIAVSIAHRCSRFSYWKPHDHSSRKAMLSKLMKEFQVGQQDDISKVENSDSPKEQHNRQADKQTVMTGPTATVSETQSFRTSSGSTKGLIKPTPPRRWENRGEFPKAPKLGVNETHFDCPLCLIRIPAEVEGEFWM